MKKTKKTTSKINYAIIEPSERIRILWKCIEKNNEEYDFYDVQYGDVIIKGISIVEGKKGAFLGMPSQLRDGEYYPIVFLAHDLSDRLLGYIEKADEEDLWEETDESYLQFEKIDGSSDMDSEPKRKHNRK